MAEDNPLTGLAKDIERINEATAGAVVRFGKLGGVSKGWTAFARVTSGSLAWKIQARLRALMNVVELITDRQASFNVELADSFRKMNELGNATKNIRKFKDEFLEMQKALNENNVVPDELIEKLRGTELFDGLMYKYKDNMKDVVEKGLEFLTYQTKKADKAIDMNEAGGFFRYHAGKAKEKTGDFLKYLKPEKIQNTINPSTAKDVKESFKAGFLDAFRSPSMFNPKSIGGFLKRQKNADIWKERLGKLQLKGTAIMMKLGNGLKLLPKLVGLVLGGLATAMLYGTAVLIGLLVVIAIIRKAWPILAKGMSTANKFAKIGTAFFWGVSRILEGIMMILSGLWEGDLIKVLKGLWGYVLPGLLAVGYSILAGIASLLVSLGVAVVGGIVSGLLHVLGKLPFIGKYIPQFAKGGVSKGGLAVVGEEGPELVSLPRGARVHPNGYGPSGGTVININVTGRVGASDAEIRDIANKVAREINLRMNTRAKIITGG